jgi:hypothetical protein
VKIHIWERAKIPLSLHFTLFTPYWRESRLFNVEGKKKVKALDVETEVVVVDVAEHEVERPKKADAIALRFPSGDTPRCARLQRALHQATEETLQR